MTGSPTSITWPAVFHRWSARAVPQVRIERLDTPQNDWADRWTTELPISYFNAQFSNPVNMTGWHLTEGIVTKTAESFAAFAIYTYLLGNTPFQHRDGDTVRLLAKDVLDRCDSRPGGSYWLRNAKNVLPSVDGLLLNRRNDRSWLELVDEAAAVWTEIAARYWVLGWPDDRQILGRP